MRLSPPVDLILVRHAEEGWTEVIRPWLEAGRGVLERAYVVVATRGQAQAWKQRCLVENVALLGVEFLTPGLARRKWRHLRESEGPSSPVMGRELLLVGLRAALARRLTHLTPVDAQWGFWKSLESDAARALDDFDELLQAGFGAGDFALPGLRELFEEVEQWVVRHGFSLASREAEQAALTPVLPTAGRVAGRVLVYGLGPEWWGEFFNVAAFVRRCERIVVALPEPDFAGAAEVEEGWVALWRSLLGVEPRSLEAADEVSSCEAVGALWGLTAGAADRAELLVGVTRRVELERVTERVVALLATGAEQIGIVFPSADVAHLTLARLLTERGVAFVDLLETAGPPPVDVQAQRAVLTFYEEGARLEALLALWPWLRAIGATTLSLADARRACERSFDTAQSHAVADYVTDWETDAPELARVAAVLLPAWPEQLALSEALARFRTLCDALQIERPPQWAPLDQLAVKEIAPLPVAVVAEALRSFLPERHPVAGLAGRATFARVTLGTRRRLQGCRWSHLILVESNAGAWPDRRESTPWLPDETRTELNRRGRFSLGLLTTEQRAALERSGYRSLAMDTAERVIFSAALFDEDEPEVKRAPNSWVERVLWAQGAVGPTGDLEQAFAALAAPPAAVAAPLPPDIAAWHAIWVGRRQPERPFDEYFFGGEPALVRPPKLSARLIERGVQDPAELWFEAVLAARRVEWGGFVRERRKALGLRAHELLAAALRPTEVQRGFGRLPEPAVAEAQLQTALARSRARWPRDVYWDSFAAELHQLCRVLLAKVYTIEAGPYVATEAWLPAGARLQLERQAIPLTGRIDLLRTDRPGWEGATVDIIDFKTGGDQELSVERMARRGASLQLGVYLSAALSLGAVGGRVWMLKPEAEGASRLDLPDLPRALARLGWLETAIERGVFGALTRDRSDYAPPGCRYPLACTPVPALILEAKFAATFGEAVEEGGDE